MNKEQNPVGRAFRGKDAVVRWVTARSQRGYYAMLWLDEQTGVWNIGGKVKERDWASSPYCGNEVQAPTGTYRLMGVLGTIREMNAFVSGVACAECAGKKGN